MDALTIGHSAQQYPEQRNIIGKVAGADYKLCRDYYSLASSLLSLAHLRGAPEWVADRPFRFQDFGLNQVDCLHFFNGVNYSRTPWVATFETFIPRFIDVLRNHSPHPVQRRQLSVWRLIAVLGCSRYQTAPMTSRLVFWSCSRISAPAFLIKQRCYILHRRFPPAVSGSFLTLLNRAGRSGLCWLDITFSGKEARKFFEPSSLSGIRPVLH